MQKLQLAAQPRTEVGKKVRKIRAEGKVPANIFGPNFKSQSVSFDLKDFNKIYKIAQETGIVYIGVNKEEVPVLIRGVQHHPVSHQILHVDLRKVDLQQKIETEVPVKIVGESPAVAQKGGVLLTQANTVVVEALPADIPHEIEIDISKLEEVGTDIKIADLARSDKYAFKDEPEKVIVSVIAHKEESLAPETAVVEPEVITEVKEGEEGVAAEAAAPAEEKGQKEKKEGEEKSPEKPEAKQKE